MANQVANVKSRVEPADKYNKKESEPANKQCSTISATTDTTDNRNKQTGIRPNYNQQPDATNEYNTGSKPQCVSK